jgi:hypothetical protein
MKSFLKKAVVITMLSSSVLSLQASRSQAIIGLVTGNIVVDCIGIITIAVGASIANGGANGTEELQRGRFTALMGLLILDEKTSLPQSYNKLTPEVAAAKLGLDPVADKAKIDAYNDAVPAINLIYQQIQSDAQDRVNRNLLLSDEAVKAFARGEWKELAPATIKSADALAILDKIQG